MSDLFLVVNECHFVEEVLKLSLRKHQWLDLSFKVGSVSLCYVPSGAADT